MWFVKQKESCEALFTRRKEGKPFIRLPCSHAIRKTSDMFVMLIQLSLILQHLFSIPDPKPSNAVRYNLYFSRRLLCNAPDLLICENGDIKPS